MTPSPAGTPPVAAPGPAFTNIRDRVAALLPAMLTLPLRSYVGNSREPELQVLRRFVRPGSSVIDIGAHKGIYTYWLRRHVGPTGTVLAYEPQPAMHDYLARGLAPRWYGNVTLRRTALSDHAGTERLTIPVVSGEAQIAWASLERGPLTGVTVDVPTVTLDHEIGDRAVDFIKCDVEGHELKVLAGCSQILRRQRPVWLLEVEHRHAGDSIQATLDLMADADYEPWYLASDGSLGVVPVDRRAPSEINTVESGRYVYNFFFVPR